MPTDLDAQYLQFINNFKMFHPLKPSSDLLISKEGPLLRPSSYKHIKGLFDALAVGAGSASRGLGGGGGQARGDEGGEWMLFAIY